ncbi:MAG: hypothetical protein JEZ00_01375 [Anaerolineaceae bacterium]|nr:hypothetical protein [Anaerolineaceae bacterium]
MEKRNSSHISIGIGLLLVGAIMLSFQLVPDLRQIIAPYANWPLIIAAFGLFLIFTGFIAQNPESITGGCFFIGLAGIFTWQVYTGDWASWAYMWTLFGAFSGAGTILSSFVAPQPQKKIFKGLRDILFSAIMFFLFSSLLGGKNWIGPYWPVLIILAGLVMLAKPLFSRFINDSSESETINN